MKNIYVLIVLSLFIVGCSDDADSPTSANSGDLSLSSYTLIYASGNTVTHNFEGLQATNTSRNGNTQLDYEYNSNGLMSKFTKYRDGSDVLESEYTFNYDGSGKLVSIDEIDLFAPNSNTSYTRTISYDGNTITSTLPKSSDSDYTVEFVLSGEKQIERFTQYQPDGSIFTRLDFTIDANGNYTNVRQSATDFSGNLVSIDYGYNYDDKINPVKAYYAANFIQTLFIYGRVVFIGSPLLQLSRTFGNNNILRTDYPDIIDDSQKFYFEYDYNDSNYPSNATVRKESDNSLSYDAEFFYD